MTNETRLPDQTNQDDRPKSGRFFGKPITSSGWWSVWLMLGFLLLMIVFYILVWSGQRGGETFFSNLLLSFPFVLAAISAFAGGIFALVGIGWKKERSVFVFIALFVGIFVSWFAFMEIAFPH
ncbi:hypothetical protein ACFLXB_06300 [Chloroflexota bacterium]